MQRVSGSKVLIGLLLALGVSGAAADQKFTETTQVTVVEVPVQVVRDGEPVRGLQATDFEVIEGRKQLPITGFDVVDLAAPETQLLSADIPAAGKRHFLLLFDLANSRPTSIARARRAVMQSLLKTLTPSDVAAVAVYSPVSGLRLILGFTSDLRRIAEAIQSVGVERNAHPYAGGWGEAASAIANGMSDVNMQGALSSQPPATFTGETEAQRIRNIRDSLIEQAMLSEQQNELLRAAEEVVQGQHDQMAEVRNAVAPLTSAFADLAQMMAAVSGRKLVVLFSQGFDSAILSGGEDFEDQFQLADATLRGLSIGVDSEERFGSTRQINQLEKMLDQFRRSDCVIESVDISGVRGMDLDANANTSGEGSLTVMARDTGGEVFRNMNDLGEAMTQLARRTSVTYVLSFQPEGLAANGSYHPIKVQLKNAPRGTKVTYRNGYYAPRPYNQQRPMEKSLAAADQLMGSNRSGSIATDVLATAFRTAAATAYVPVFVEADGKTLLDGSGGKVVPAEIYAYAVDASGFVHDSFNQTLQIDLDKAGPMLRQGGLKYYGHLELPPGDFAIRVLLRNGVTGAFGKRTVLVHVPAFGSDHAVLLPPLFPEAPGRWAVVRETPRGQQKDAAYPFVLGQQAFMPASLPALRPGDETALALVGYNLAGDFKPEARVQSADGRDLGSCTIRVGGLVPGGDSRPAVFKAVFGVPQDLAPGSYRLVVTGTGTAGPPTVTSAFTIARPAAGLPQRPN